MQPDRAPFSSCCKLASRICLHNACMSARGGSAIMTSTSMSTTYPRGSTPSGFRASPHWPSRIAVAYRIMTLDGQKRIEGGGDLFALLLELSDGNIHAT